MIDYAIQAEMNKRKQNVRDELRRPKMERKWKLWARWVLAHPARWYVVTFIAGFVAGAVVL